MDETTQNYGLEIIDKKTEVVSPDKINRNMVMLDTQLKSVQTQLDSIDVTTSVENVINRRVNIDTSKSLGTLISTWLDTVKTAILDAIGLLPQKSVWTDSRGAKLDNLNQSMTTTQTNIVSAVNNARDSIKTHITDISQKCYNASATDTVVLATSKTVSSNSPFAEFTPKYNGWVTINVTGSRTNTQYTTYLKFINPSMVDNSTTYPLGNMLNTPLGGTFTKEGTGVCIVGAFTTGESYSVDIPVIAGQTIRFFANSGLTITKLSIGYSEVTL